VRSILGNDTAAARSLSAAGHGLADPVRAAGYGRGDTWTDRSSHTAARPARPAPASPAGAGRAPPDPAGFIGHVGVPDALVYTLGAANLPRQRHFVLVNPLTGTATHFISHKNPHGNPHGSFLDGPLRAAGSNRVEAVHYGLSQATRREDGYVWVWKVGDVTLFFNARGGDTNLLRSDHGVAGNFGFFGPPAALSALTERLTASGNSRVQALGRGFAKGLQVAGAAGSQFGVAWRVTVTIDARSGEAVLDVSGRKIPLGDFIQAMSGLPGLNRGSSAVALAQNREDYLAGANPYALADYTRTAQGQLRNHGDPVSAIAGGAVELGRLLLPGSDPVRSNARARSVLELAIARDKPPLTPDQRGLHYGKPVDPMFARGIHPLTAGQRLTLHATLRQLDRYGIDFGSAIVRSAARAAAKPQPVGAAAPLDRQFVRDVFEGDFRTEFMHRGNHPLFDLVVGLNRTVGIFSGILNAGPVAPDGQWIQQMRARAQGLQARLDAFHGGVLKALGIDARGLDDKARAALAQRAGDLLASSLETRLAARGTRPLSSQSLYEAFQALSRAERAAIGARINAAVAPHGAAGLQDLPPAAGHGPGASKAYVVERGDTLWTISARHLGDGRRYLELYQANRPVIGDSPDRLRAGMTLRIPD